MAFEFRLPDIGEGVAEGEIVRWFVAEGDRVERDQPMVEVLTDKANVEIPAPRAGTILKILAAEGQIVPVETALVVIGEPGETVGDGGTAATHAERTISQSREAERVAGVSDARASGGAPPAAAGEPGTQAASAPPAAREGVREQPDAPARPVRTEERDAGVATRTRRSAGVDEGNGGDGRAGPSQDVAQDAASRRRRISPDDRVLAMPAVRKLARERGVDLDDVAASGSQGHVLREDVERFLAERIAPRGERGAEPAGGALVRPPRRRMEEPEPATAASVTRMAPRPLPRRAAAEGPDEEVVPYRGVRRQIGKRMAQSAFTAPHYTYVEEVDAEALVTLRKESLSFAQEQGVRLTYLPFIMKALVPCLRAYPLLNAVLDEDAQRIRLKKRYHIGIATASEEGLVVPVVRDVDRLGVLEIADEIARLSEAARDRSITIDELRGSTFTITSLGPLGGLLATPIINYPEVAILGVHAIKQKPVIKNGAVVPGHVMNVSLSFDHRVVDGAIGAEFTRMLVRYLENPQLLLLEG